MKNTNKSSLFENRYKYGYLFILPLIIGVVLIFIPNIVQTFLYSVSGITAPGDMSIKFEDFSKYKDAFFTDANFVPYLVNNLRKLLVDVPVIVIYSLLVSTILNQKFKGRVVARIVFFIPVILSTGILSKMDNTAMFYTGAGQAIDTGVSSNMSVLADMSTMLKSLNFPEFLTNIISNSISNIYDIACMSGIQIYIFLAGLQEIPSSLYEAASIEGCSKWELFWKITFPMLTPQIAINSIYTISASVTDSNIVLNYTNSLAFNESQYSLATAMNIIYLLTLGVFVFVVFMILKKLMLKFIG